MSVEPSSEIALALADRAHEVMAEIQAVGQSITARWLRLGQLLTEVKGDELWRCWGCESFEAALGLPEIGLSRSYAYGLIEVWEVFIDSVPPVGPADLADHYQQLAKVGVRKLRQLVPVVKEHPDQAAEWLDRAEALSASGLRQEIRAANGVERSEEDEWYERRFRAIQAICQRAIDRTMPRGTAADEIIDAGMKLREATERAIRSESTNSGERATNLESAKGLERAIFAESTMS